MMFNRDIKGSMSEWLKEADCKSARYAYAGSNPARPIPDKKLIKNFNRQQLDIATTWGGHWNIYQHSRLSDVLPTLEG